MNLQKGATGAKKLAVLRMDVDDLGKIFSIGLEDNETISRVATLSRFMNHFFKNCIDLICRGEVDADAPRIKSGRGKKDVVVVYSGGDDLFIVGAWDHVFELAFEIEDAFRKYVRSNPNITLSAGYGIFDPKFPLYRMAEITGKREEKAKTRGKLLHILMTWKSKARTEFTWTKGGIYEIRKGVKFKKSYEWGEFRRIWAEFLAEKWN